MTILTGTITVRSQEFEVRYNPEWSTEFVATVGTKIVRSNSWKGLSNTIGTELRKSDILVDVRFVDPVSGRRGTTTKIHAGTGYPMIEWEDGTRSQENVHDVLRPDIDVAELKRLGKEVLAAKNALLSFQKKHALGGTYESLKDIIDRMKQEKANELEAAEALKGVEAVELDEKES